MPRAISTKARFWHEKCIGRQKGRKRDQKRKSKQERRFFLLGLLFVSPWLIGFLCFQLYPILSALYYSFTDFNIFQPAEFTGLDNYVTLFNDKYFPVSIKNTAVMSFIGMPIGLVVALALAVLLSKEVKGMPAFRTIYYLPTVVPIVASAMLFCGCSTRNTAC